MDTIPHADAFLSLSPEVSSFFMSPPPPAFAAQDYVFAHQEIEPTSSTTSSTNPTLDFPQLSSEYPPLMSPELLQLFAPTEFQNFQVAPQFMVMAQDFLSHPSTLSFPSDMIAQVAATNAISGECTLISHPNLDLKEGPSSVPWSSYLEILTNSSLFPNRQFIPQLPTTTIADAIKQDPMSIATTSSTNSSASSSCTSSPTNTPVPSPPQSSSNGSLHKVHQRLLQRLRKSQQDCPTPDPPSPSQDAINYPDEANVIVSESSKKADSSFDKVLELFSYYFNTQKTASPLACTAALYLGQVGFELQKRYEAYSRYIKNGILEESLVSIIRAAKLRKLGIKSYEEFLRAEVSELRRIKDPERYLNRRMQVFQSYEPDELEGVYLSFDALYLLAKKPPSFRKEWLEEGKVRIVHICEIHDAWRSCPLNKTKRARTASSEDEESCDVNPKASKVLKTDR